MNRTVAADAGVPVENRQVPVYVWEGREEKLRGEGRGIDRAGQVEKIGI